MRIRHITPPAKDRRGAARENSFENGRVKFYRLGMQQEDLRRVSATERWTKRVGVAAFLFFLVKGLLWLIVPAIVAYFTVK